MVKLQRRYPSDVTGSNLGRYTFKIFGHINWRELRKNQYDYENNSEVFQSCYDT